jgi:hypothetical protein
MTPYQRGYVGYTSISYIKNTGRNTDNLNSEFESFIKTINVLV